MLSMGGFCRPASSRPPTLPVGADGLLLLDRTPRQAWAEQHLAEPIELNDAPPTDQISGIGPRSVERVIAARLRDIRQPKSLGLMTRWHKPTCYWMEGRHRDNERPGSLPSGIAATILHAVGF